MVAKVLISMHWTPALTHASVVVVVEVVVVVVVDVVVVDEVVDDVVVEVVVVDDVVDVVVVDDVVEVVDVDDVVEVVVVIAATVVGADVVLSHDVAHTLLQHVIPVSHRPLFKYNLCFTTAIIKTLLYLDTVAVVT